MKRYRRVTVLMWFLVFKVHCIWESIYYREGASPLKVWPGLHYSNESPSYGRDYGEKRLHQALNWSTLYLDMAYCGANTLADCVQGSETSLIEECCVISHYLQLYAEGNLRFLSKGNSRNCFASPDQINFWQKDKIIKLYP